MQEELADDNAVTRQILFKCVYVFVSLLPDVLGNQRVRQLLRLQDGGMHSHNQNFFVVRAIEYPYLAALRNASVRPPQIIVIQFFGARRFERMNVASLRIHAGHDVLDHAIFAGGVHRLKTSSSAQRSCA